MFGSTSSGSAEAGPSRLAKQAATQPPVNAVEQPLARASAWLGGRKLSKGEVDELLWNYRNIASAGTASLVSTAASFPFDSLKSRLQVKYYPSIWACGKAVMKEEGMKGFFRGVWIPLITISFVRTSSFSIYVGTKDALHARGYLNGGGPASAPGKASAVPGVGKKADAERSLLNTALSGSAGGATSGVIISCGSAPFELVKVQRQLEYLTAVQHGLVAKAGTKYRARSGFQAAAEVWKNHRGPRGFYLGFPLHICRDTLGTALYFGFYDTLRSLVLRHGSPVDGKGGKGSHQLFGLPGPMVAFLSGSTAGIASWLLVYPIDLVKTNVQQRALSGHGAQMTGWQLFNSLLRERPPPNPRTRDTAARRFLRLYRGLGVSALRSFISHGLTWMIIETVSERISQRRPLSASDDESSTL